MVIELHVFTFPLFHSLAGELISVSEFGQLGKYEIFSLDKIFTVSVNWDFISMCFKPFIQAIPVWACSELLFGLQIKIKQ